MEEIKGKLITLRPLEESFFSDYIKMFSPKVRELLHVSGKQFELDYLHNRLEKQKLGTTLFYCIFENKKNKLIGAVEIRYMEETDSQLYSWLNEAYWGRGMYQEALLLISKEYFKEKKELFFRANVDFENIRSYRALKKYGFIDVGFTQGPNGIQYRLIFRKK